MAKEKGSGSVVYKVKKGETWEDLPGAKKLNLGVQTLSAGQQIYVPKPFERTAESAEYVPIPTPPLIPPVQPFFAGFSGLPLVEKAKQVLGNIFSQPTQPSQYAPRGNVGDLPAQAVNPLTGKRDTRTLQGDTPQSPDALAAWRAREQGGTFSPVPVVGTPRPEGEFTGYDSPNAQAWINFWNDPQRWAEQKAANENPQFPGFFTAGGQGPYATLRQARIAQGKFGKGGDGGGYGDGAAVEQLPDPTHVMTPEEEAILLLQLRNQSQGYSQNTVWRVNP